ncbi:MAG: GNAT family N-acetyltransferase, partial [Rhodospirillaceae bacterium]
MITPADISPETNEADVKAEKVQIQNSGPMLVEALSSADRSAPAQAAPASDDDGQSEEESFPPEHMAMASLKTWGDLPGEIRRRMRRDVTLDCGWGRLIFGQTFDDAQTLAEALREEDPGRRDIAIYLRDPQVVLAMAPQELFLDPSHTYRLYLEKPMPDWTQPQGFFVRPVETLSDADAIDRIYRSRNMVPPYEGFVWRSRLSSIITYLVAEDTLTGDIVGVVTGVDHKNAFNDPDNGSSLWALAVDTQCPHAGVGEALTRVLANHFRARGRDFMDLSVVHDNAMAIKLYEKLGFVQVPAFALKNKNGINEKLFVGPQVTAKLNPYATLLVNEARRRGIAVQVDDAEGGFFTLSLGGRTISCRESLTDLTSAVALSRCDDKAVTRRLLDAAGLQVPGQTKVELDSSPEEIKAFLKRYRRVVVKPARGEQGRGISVDLRDDKSVRSAIEAARQPVADPDVIEVG